MPTPDPFEVRPPNPGETVFRLLDRDRPTLEDFFSDEEDGRTDTLHRSLSVAIYRGFSTRDTLARALNLARTLGKPFVAELQLDVQDGDSIAHTFKRGHRTVWVEAEQALSRVIAVYAVDDYS